MTPGQATYTGDLTVVEARGLLESGPPGTRDRPGRMP